MSRNPGRTFEIMEGTYKGNYFDSRNKEQQEQFLKDDKLVGKVCKDYLGMNVIAKNIVISASKLKLIGYID